MANKKLSDAQFDVLYMLLTNNYRMIFTDETIGYTKYAADGKSYSLLHKAPAKTVKYLYVNGYLDRENNQVLETTRKGYDAFCQDDRGKKWLAENYKG